MFFEKKIDTIFRCIFRNIFRAVICHNYLIHLCHSCEGGGAIIGAYITAYYGSVHCEVFSGVITCRLYVTKYAPMYCCDVYMCMRLVW